MKHNAGGTCGYGNLYDAGYGVLNAALSQTLFNDGASCGQCYLITCDGSRPGSEYCKPGTSITVSATNLCPANYALPNGGWCGPGRPHFFFEQIWGSLPTISLIERAPRRSRYNDPYKDYLGKPRKNVRSARPKREKKQKRLHGHIPNSNATQEYTKCILPIVHGTSAEQLACQVHRSQNATTTPLAATPLCGHPPTIWEGLPTEWGLRVSGAS